MRDFEGEPPPEALEGPTGGAGGSDDAAVHCVDVRRCGGASECDVRRGGRELTLLAGGAGRDLAAERHLKAVVRSWCHLGFAAY